MPERLARMHVGEMDLDERQLHREQGVTKRDAGVGEGAGIEDEEFEAFGACALDSVDQHVFGVALAGVERMAELDGERPRAVDDRFERVRAVDSRLSLTQQIQIRSVEQQQTGHVRQSCNEGGAI